MFGQIFASPPFGDRMGRSRPSVSPGPRKIRASIHLSSVLRRTLDRLLAAAPSAPPRRVKNGVFGVFFYLAGIALVGAITIGVFFGVGLYSLAHPTEGSAAALAVRHDERAAPLLAVTETPPSARVADDRSKGAAPLPATSETSSSSAIPGDISKAAAAVPPPRAEPAAPEPTKSLAGMHSEPNRFGKATSKTISGAVIEVPDAMTWIVADRSVQLWGIRPGPSSSAPLLSSFVDGVRAKGPVACHKHAHSSRYQCSTTTGEDIAGAAILAGVGRVAEGATPGYRAAEKHARQKGRGLWAKL